MLNKNIFGGNSDCIGVKLSIDNFNNFINLAFIFLIYSIYLNLVNKYYYKNLNNEYDLNWSDISYIKDKYLWIDICIIFVLELVLQIFINSLYVPYIKLIALVIYFVLKFIDNKSYIINLIKQIIDKIKTKFQKII